MRKVVLSVLFLVFVLAAGRVAQAGSIIIDQRNAASAETAACFAPACILTQEVTSGRNGWLQGFDMVLEAGVTSPVTARVRVGATITLDQWANAGTVAATHTVTPDGTGHVYFDFSGDNIYFNAGDRWYLEYFGTPPPGSGWDWLIPISGNAYAGHFYINRLADLGHIESYGAYDMIFTEYVSDPVPEPASLVLLGTGLVGLRAWRRRKR